MSTCRVAAVALATLSLSLSVSARSTQAPAPAAGRGAGAGDPDAVERGRALLTAQCASCHGADGRGAGPLSGGVDLLQSPLIATDTQLSDFLKVGRPERRMPAFTLADADAADLGAFLRSSALAGRGIARGRGGPVAAVVGDPKAGETYFNGAGGCATCHSPAGDLKGIGTRLPAATIQGRLVLPRGNGGYPGSFRSPEYPNEKPRTVVVTPASGPAISGAVLWVTDFNVTLVDGQGIRRTIARNGGVPKVVITDPLQAHLDHMRILTDDNMHNLTAFLVGLK